MVVTGVALAVCALCLIAGMMASSQINRENTMLAWAVVVLALAVALTQLVPLFV